MLNRFTAPVGQAPCARSQQLSQPCVLSGLGRSVHPGAPERGHLVVARSAPEDPEPSNMDELRQKYFGTPPSTAKPGSSSGVTDADLSPLDNVNPYALGRQARKAFDQVWSAVSNLASPTKSFIIDDTLEPRGDFDFEFPQAAYTTVLVVGATGRVGRVLARKLLLRGYKVKALVRQRQAGQRGEETSLPPAVELVYGDLGDMESCHAAVRGVNKVIFCASARSNLTADLMRVDEGGVLNIVKALQDEFSRVAHRQRLQEHANANTPDAHRMKRRLYSNKSKKEVADFSKPFHQAKWDVTFVGTPEEREAQAAAAAAAAEEGAEEEAQPASRRLQRPAGDRWVASGRVVAEINLEDHLVFEGGLSQWGAYAEVGARVQGQLPGGEHRFKDTEAIVMRLRGDGNQYACALTTHGGHTYIARFPTREGFLTIRLPYGLFRPEKQGSPPLNPSSITHMAIRFEARRPPGLAAAARSARGMAPRQADANETGGKFSMEVDWIKTSPAGVEPDVVLVSASRGASIAGVSPLDCQRIIDAKRKGEESLRLSGLGYTIIRPGTLVEEPGGYKALVFDQGDRIDQPISAADVADLCLRALHEPSAFNKTFEVCYEIAMDTGNSMYELVTSAPDKSGSYLAQAASTLVKNT